MSTRLLALIGIWLYSFLCSVTASQENVSQASSYALTMYGEPTLQADFTHFPYANPDAPKGRRITFGLLGNFDSLNPYPVKGVTAAQGIANFIVEPLMRRSLDEAFTLYPLLAQRVDMPEGRDFVTFHLNPKARFSDGHALTSDDVKFTFNLLKAKGRPNYRNAFNKVKQVETPDALTIRFDLREANDRELPLILGLMPVLPRHATEQGTFEQAGFKPLVGSGPYLVGDVKPGESITYKRAPDYWGKDLPVNRGAFNADEIRFDYYRDSNSLFEAFKAGLYDVRFETDPTRWLTGYDFPALKQGRVIVEAIPSRLPKGMSGLVMNIRRPLFQDIKTREALIDLFDFEWINRNLFGGVYKRTSSFFEGAPNLSSQGQPVTEYEKTLLAPYLADIHPDILNGTWKPAQSDGSGRNRDNARNALKKLEQAGLLQKEGKLQTAKGEPFSFEILVVSRDQERIALNYAQKLSRVGIEANVRLVDNVQYERRRQRFEFDMMFANWPVSPSPGNEQFFRWGSASAGREGSFNFAGVTSKAVDAMIEALLSAKTKSEFTSAARALDRVLLSGFYVVPLYNLPDQWLARNAVVKRPQVVPLFGLSPEWWWREAH